MAVESERFQFGNNWMRFLRLLDAERIKQAELSLCAMLGVNTLKGLSFLDIGSGSGLFSLAAAQLGAERIHSFDYDPQSVNCTKYLRDNFFGSHSGWQVDQASVLDKDYLATLGKFDVVYSWGVLHHTGAMWSALDNVIPLLKDNGKLFIAIYNDQGFISDCWVYIKKLYNRLPSWASWLYAACIWAPIETISVAIDLLKGKKLAKFRNKQDRGMSYWHDVIDWIGGYPFEVAKPEDVIQFYTRKGLTIKKTRFKKGQGCNEFVFTVNGHSL